MSIPLKNIEELSERLIYIRRVTGLSQAQLAAKAGTTQQAIQQAEAGKARNPRYLNKLALDLEIPAEWLSMNMMPGEKALQFQGLKEKDSEFIEGYLSLPSGKQKIIRDVLEKQLKDKK